MNQTSPMRSRFWRMKLGQLARPVTGDPPVPAGTASEFTFDDLCGARARFGSCTMVRDDQVVGRSSLGSHVLVVLLLHGSMRWNSNGQAVEVRRGDIGFFDLANTAQFETGNGSCLSLLVPRRHFRSDVHGLVLRRSHLPCEMLSSQLQQLLPTTPPAARKTEALAQSTLAVLQLCVDFAPRVRAGGATASLRAGILAYIDTHLDDARLCPGTLVDEFGISRTWLYRIFAGSGGVKRYIRDKRLDAAFQDLGALPDRRIIDIAYHRGFSTERQFQRAFLQRFGSTASEVRDRRRIGS